MKGPLTLLSQSVRRFAQGLRAMIWPFVGFKVYGTRCFRAYETRNQSPAVKHGKTSS